MLNFLDEPLLTTVSLEGSKAKRSIPGTLAVLVRGEVAFFASLRSHQRHVWHAFLVQLAALALEKNKDSGLPDDEISWRKLLRGLTPLWPGDEPWSLVEADVEKPALLQAPIPGGELPQSRQIATPDGIDILVSSKNHDLKASRMYRAAPEDWLFALVSLQTQQGIMGAGKYGISRMNGGYGARPALGLEKAEEPGFRFRHDVLALLSAKEQDLNPQGLRGDGLALLWLEPWDGAQSIAFHRLHPFYIEICRRVRLGITDGRISAADAPSKGPRLSGTEDLKGNTGDPWTPVGADGKSFTVTAEGFSSRKFADLLNASRYRLPASIHLSEDDCGSGLTIVAQSVCRGQGKTQGYHERRLFIPPEATGLFRENRGTLSEILERRTAASGDLRMAMRFGLFVLCQRGPAAGLFDKEATRRFVEPALDQFSSAADEMFFDGLWEEMAADEASRSGHFEKWLRAQHTQAQRFLAEAPLRLPLSTSRRYWARAQSDLAFRSILAKSVRFAPVVRFKRHEEIPSVIN